LGLQGWELVSIAVHLDENREGVQWFSHYFKRPVEETIEENRAHLRKFFEPLSTSPRYLKGDAGQLIDGVDYFLPDK